MDALVDAIEDKRSQVGCLVDSRMKEFKCTRTRDELFSELCFCILTANFNAERAIKIQEEIGDGFITLPEKKLAIQLKKLGHRYPNARAKYIVEARKYRDKLPEILDSLQGNELREWFVENIKGLGYKEASHFLRNIGFDDYAIIDRHIINIMVEYGLIERPKNISGKKYLEMEEILRKLGSKLGLTLAELDLILWCKKTGKVLK